MRFSSARLVLLALIVILSPFVATASDGRVATPIPGDADILITDGRGVIVGIGETHDGTTFRLTLVEGFSGAATLTFVLDDGSFEELEVTIVEGGVSIDGRPLGDLLADSFTHVAIGRETPGSRPSNEAAGPDEAGDRGPVDVPDEAGPADDGDREPATPELPSVDLPAVEPSTGDLSADDIPLDEPTLDRLPTDERSTDAPREASDRRSP